MSMKKISPNVLMALENALSLIFWYKNDLKEYLLMSLEHKEILSVVNWSDTKRNIVAQVVLILNKNETIIQEELIHLITAVSTFNDYSRLKMADNPDTKIQAAKEAVNALYQVTKSFIDYKAEEEQIEKRKKINKEKFDSINRKKQRLEELKNEFIELSMAKDLQKRGYDLENFFDRLFTLYDIDHKSSFKVIGEQIDGSFSLNNDEYLLEVKWRKDLTAINDLDAFAGKISRRLDNTLGLFISINGFSEDATLAFSGGKKLMYLMDGNDLMGILEERITLPDLLRKKKRAAVQYGNIYLKIKDIL